MKILVINTGSSSIKYQLMQMEDTLILAHGAIEKIGKTDGRLINVTMLPSIRKTVRPFQATDHEQGMYKIVDLLTDAETGVLKETSEVDAIGHRVVHGAETFRTPTIIDEEVLEAIQKNVPLAPIHNPSNIVGIRITSQIFPAAVHVAVFDTAFHQTIPAKAYLYALPYDLYTRLRIRRYGFHGTSHHYVAMEAARLLKRRLEMLNLITIHLGNGSSITAIKDGKSKDTSMGMTPLEGLIMGTRSGDIDPSIPLFLAQHRNLSGDQINTLLNSESGLKGICGLSDMRDVMDAANRNVARAKTALEMYVYRIKKYLGGYLAILGRLDGIVFTAGIGEHSTQIRSLVCENLDHLGIILDEKKNTEESDKPREIQTTGSLIKILVIPTNEELMIARETEKLLFAHQTEKANPV